MLNPLPTGPDGTGYVDTLLAENELMNLSNSSIDSVVNVNQVVNMPEVNDVLVDEVNKALEHFPNGNLSSIDGIPVRSFKGGTNNLTYHLKLKKVVSV